MPRADVQIDRELAVKERYRVEAELTDPAPAREHPPPVGTLVARAKTSGPCRRGLDRNCAPVDRPRSPGTRQDRQRVAGRRGTVARRSRVLDRDRGDLDLVTLPEVRAACERPTGGVDPSPWPSRGRAALLEHCESPRPAGRRRRVARRRRRGSRRRSAHHVRRVRDDDDRPPVVLEQLHPIKALLLESLVTDGEHLVDEQDVRDHVDSDREAEPHDTCQTSSTSPGCR